MDPITYKLNLNGSAASTYYPAVAQFTDDVLDLAENTIAPIAQSFRKYIIDYELEDPRSAEEYTYELINLGVLWRAYGNTALTVEFAPFHFLARLGEWRKTHPRLKPAIDFLRGILLSFFLVQTPLKRTYYPPCGQRDIERLVNWLEATGDFREDAFRYVRWLGYCGTRSLEEIAESILAVVTFTDWFEIESEARMGMFTPNVESFVENNNSRYRWREDRFSCLRSRAEYHLNMVGAEIMNRAYRNEFTSCKQKTVLLPGCMRARTEEKCEGVKTAKGIQCTGCESACRVNQLREMGMRNNFDVMIIPHSTDLSKWTTKPGEEKHAVVGVACLSVLVEGGWELKRNNVPAQCVLLNECGCKKHWHKNGFPTELDVRELKKVISSNGKEKLVKS
jgi:uncharacterized protein